MQPVVLHKGSEGLFQSNVDIAIENTLVRVKG